MDADGLGFDGPPLRQDLLKSLGNSASQADNPTSYPTSGKNSALNRSIASSTAGLTKRQFAVLRDRLVRERGGKGLPLDQYPLRERIVGGNKLRRAPKRRPIAAALPTLDKWDHERLWEKVDLGAEGQCWNWLGGLSGDGYGRFKVAGKLYSPHRLIAALFYGPIENVREYHGSVVLHRCDNPRCCNPDHLRIGTQLDNVEDMHAKGRGHRNSPPAFRDHLLSIAASPLPAVSGVGASR